jgi:hypothetical protein
MELWLITRAYRISTRPPSHPDEFHGKVGKPQSIPGQDLAWIEAISTPDCQATDRYLRKALKDLESWEYEAYSVLSRVYLATNADEALPEKWRREASNTQIPLEKRSARVMGLHLLEDAFAFVLYRAHRDRMLFIWPSPERAKGMVKTNEAKKREARYHYVQARERGEGTTTAVRKAYLAASCSEQAVWKWRHDENWESLIAETEHSNPKARVEHSC